jgi:hypothetical protein
VIRPNGIIKMFLDRLKMVAAPIKAAYKKTRT